jgi:hypothetical protein
MNEWRTMTTPITRATGTHDLFFVFRGPADRALFNFDYWRFGK